MSTLILEVDDKQKEAIRLLADLLNIKVKEVNEPQDIDPKALKNAVHQVFGIWKDIDMDFEDWRREAWLN